MRFMNKYYIQIIFGYFSSNCNYRISNDSGMGSMNLFQIKRKFFYLVRRTLLKVTSQFSSEISKHHWISIVRLYWICRRWERWIRILSSLEMSAKKLCREQFKHKINKLIWLINHSYSKALVPEIPSTLYCNHYYQWIKNHSKK